MYHDDKEYAFGIKNYFKKLQFIFGRIGYLAH